jgi:hypothetical protein
MTHRRTLMPFIASSLEQSLQESVSAPHGEKISLEPLLDFWLSIFCCILFVIDICTGKVQIHIIFSKIVVLRRDDENFLYQSFTSLVLKRVTQNKDEKGNYLSKTRVHNFLTFFVMKLVIGPFPQLKQ